MCMFSSPKVNIPKPPPAPMPEDANVAADRALRKRAGAKGFPSTILSSPLGASGRGQAALKTLLGS